MAFPTKSTAEHERDGTIRTRHRDRQDIALAVGEPQKPLDMTPIASRLWDDILDGRPDGFKSQCDWAELAAMCMTYSDYVEVSQEAREATDRKVRYTLRCEAAMLWKCFKSSSSEFGLNPAARCKLKAEPSKKPKNDPISTFLKAS